MLCELEGKVFYITSPRPSEDTQRDPVSKKIKKKLKKKERKKKRKK